MSTSKLIEAIEVQIAMAEMMPANFSRQAIDVIGLLLVLYRLDPSNKS
jgi:RNA-binding protein YhbY